MSNRGQKGNAERQIISAYELSTGRKSEKYINTEIIKNMKITGTVRTHEEKVFPLVIFFSVHSLMKALAQVKIYH